MRLFLKSSLCLSPGCEFLEKSKVDQNKGFSPPPSPPLSSPPSPLSLQPPDGSDVQSARGLAPIKQGVQPPTPGNSHTA
jgi:hypothetical protein